MTPRKVRDYLLWIFVAIVQLWNETEAFAAFRARQPGADVWSFLADRGPYYLAIILAALAIVTLAIWIERKLPHVDADRTGFHEKDVH